MGRTRKILGVDNKKKKESNLRDGILIDKTEKNQLQNREVNDMEPAGEIFGNKRAFIEKKEKESVQ